MPPSPLTPQIAARIIDYARDQPLRANDHLPAQKLADLFRVSRSPVNDALKLLEARGSYGARPTAASSWRRTRRRWPPTAPADASPEAGEEAYFQLADDRLSGRLPDRVSENEIMRRYGLSRSEAIRILTRMAREGWVERLPGKGWGFLPVLTSDRSLPHGLPVPHRHRARRHPAARLRGRRGGVPPGPGAAAGACWTATTAPCRGPSCSRSTRSSTR